MHRETEYSVAEACAVALTVILSISAGVLLMLAVASGSKHRPVFACLGGILGLLAAPYIWAATMLAFVERDVQTHAALLGQATADYSVLPLQTLLAPPPLLLQAPSPPESATFEKRA
jgi:hypothetical protein